MSYPAENLLVKGIRIGGASVGCVEAESEFSFDTRDGEIICTAPYTFTRSGDDQYAHDGKTNRFVRLSANQPKVEPQGYAAQSPGENYITYSNDFSNADWILTNGTLTATTAPDGTNDAHIFTTGVGGSPCAVQSASYVFTPSVDINYIASCYVKKTTSRAYQAEIAVEFVGTSGSSSLGVDLNTETGAVTQVGTGHTFVAMGSKLHETAYGDWWRVWISGTKVGDNSSTMRMRVNAGGGSNGDTNTFWGAMFDNQLFTIVNLIPTEGTVPLATGADALVINAVPPMMETGAGDKTVFAQSTLGYDTAGNHGVFADDTSADNTLRLIHLRGDPNDQARFVHGVGGTFDTTTDTSAVEQEISWVGTHTAATNTLELFINGVSEGTATSVNLGANNTEFYIGALNNTGGSPINGWVKRVAFYDGVLTPAQIACVGTGTSRPVLPPTSELQVTVQDGLILESQPNGLQTTAESFRAVVTGGVAPYTYSWTRVSGGVQMSANSSTSSSTAFNGTGTDQNTQEVWQCEVTDSDTPANTATSQGFIDFTWGTPP